MSDHCEEEVRLRAMKIANAVAFPMVLKAAVELGVIEALSAAKEGTWLSPSEIASGLPTTPANPQAPTLLDRMLRVLTSYEVVKCRTVQTGETGRTGRVYSAEPVCRFFLNDNGDSGSLVSLFLMFHGDVFIKAWNHTKDIVLEGKEPFASAHGMSLFEYAGSNAAFSEFFNRAMSETTLVYMKKILEVYQGFEDVNVLVDVGGGVGTVLHNITSKYPKIKGINFDLAGVVANAPSYPGVEHVAGDMFVDVPKGDAIFMKWILHDWSDEQCVTILKNCWRSLPDKGKAIVVDMVTLEEPKSGDTYSNVTFDFDLLMCSQCSGGRERTKAEFEELALSSGFRSCEFFRCAAPYWVIEFLK